MQLRTGFLETKVARRIFLLFLACALVPIAAAGAVGYHHVRGELLDQGRERLRGTSKTLGMVAFHRIDHLETVLATVAVEVRAGAVDRGAGLRLALESASRSRPTFDGLALAGTPGAGRAWGGEVAVPTTLASSDAKRLREGEPVLVVQDTEGDAARVLLGRAVDPPDPEEGVVWGAVDASALWQEEALPTGGTLCVLGPDGGTVRCPGGPPADLREALEARAVGGGTADLRWEGEDGERLAGVWSLFLRGRFGADPWTVTVSQPVQGVAAPLADFRRSFLLVLALTLIVVLYASNVQIRRSLVPLRKLRDGTRRVARGEFGRPVDVDSGDEFEELADSFNEMTREIARLLGELDDLAWGALLALARTVDAKSTWTAGHSERVTRMSVALGRELGLDEEELAVVARGTLIHDLGKVAVPSSILDKPGPLTGEEWAEMKRHPEVGARILEPIPGYDDILAVVRQHHERWDGRGYPDGRAGEEIDPLARLVAVADAFDAMTSDRPYREGVSVERALEIVREEAGAQFEPRSAEAFVALVKREGDVAATVSVSELEELASGGGDAG